jgi:hypothetical protein
VQGEYYQIGVNQSKLPGVPALRLGFNGGYVEGSWVLTGEPHPYDPERGSLGEAQSRSSVRRRRWRPRCLVKLRLATALSISTATSFPTRRKASPAGAGEENISARGQAITRIPKNTF